MRVMEGVRILEVAQFTFVPAAGGILADWGADVIKIEHPQRGDAQRGFLNVTGIPADPERHMLMEHPNRGKRSVGIDLSTEGGQALLYDIARVSDVFLTNYLPSVRQKNKFDIEHIRAANPNIIYARGSAYGDKGPERDVGGFDSSAFWTRGGVGRASTPEALEGLLAQPVAAFGDSIGGMNIAGGISAALFHRERNGVAPELDVSLLSTAWWAMGAGIDIAMETGTSMQSQMPISGSHKGNPLVGNFITSDGGVICLTTLVLEPYFRDFFEHLDLSEALMDPRFSTAEALMENWETASVLIKDRFALHSFDYWRKKLRSYKGQWAPAQSMLDLVSDEQAIANDMIFEVEPSDGGAPMKLVRGPIQFNHEPTKTARCPRAWEHTETFLMEIGVDWDRIERLKAEGAIA